MEIRLAPEALYSSDSYNEHRVRLRRRGDGEQLPEGVTDVECPDTAWENAGARLLAVDPDGEKALARFRRYHSGS
jgi:anti-sigma factor ChrR (cupin superfamily)